MLHNYEKIFLITETHLVMEAMDIYVIYRMVYHANLVKAEDVINSPNVNFKHMFEY